MNFIVNENPALTLQQARARRCCMATSLPASLVGRIDRVLPFNRSRQERMLELGSPVSRRSLQTAHLERKTARALRAQDKEVRLAAEDARLMRP